MFISEAHSVTLQARLAITLAWVAGYTNAITLLVCHTATSHMSGATSSLGIALVEQQWEVALLAVVLLCSFVLGSSLAALATELAKIKDRKSVYVGPMILQAITLSVFALCIEFLPPEHLTVSPWLYVLLALAAAAMGIQNATITSISRGVVRTTHVTGVLTDLGYEATQYVIRRFSAAARLAVAHNEEHAIVPVRLALLASIIGSFALGAALGTVSHEAFARFSMFPPVLFLLWIILVDLLRPIASVVPATIEPGPGINAHWDDSLRYFRVVPDQSRPRAKQRMPNIGLLIARLPSVVQTVIIDLSELAPLEHATERELRLLARKIRRDDHSRGREVRFIASARGEPLRPPFYATHEEALNSKGGPL